MMVVMDYLSAQPEMITKSFKVTGISLALDGSEDHLLRNKDILQLVDISEDEEMMKKRILLTQTGILKVPVRMKVLMNFRLHVASNGRLTNVHTV